MNPTTCTSPLSTVSLSKMMILLFYSVELILIFHALSERQLETKMKSFDFSHSCIACFSGVCNREKDVFIMYIAKGRGFLFLYQHIFCTSPRSKMQGVYVDKYSSCIFTFFLGTEIL